MPTLVIVGAQWGDEAKGKLVDVLGSQSDLVVRYSGGNNAGHTVIVGDQEYKFHLIPAGILHPNVVAVLGAGMVVCPKGLLEEWDRTLAMKSDLGELRISPPRTWSFPTTACWTSSRKPPAAKTPSAPPAGALGPPTKTRSLD